MGAVEDMMCVVCVSYKGRNSGDGCDLASTLCKYDLRKGDLFDPSWAWLRRVRKRAGKYLFTAANVWWRCAQYLYFVIAFCGLDA